VNPHPTHGSLGPPKSSTQTTSHISIGSAVFAQMTAGCPYTLWWDAPSPLKIALSHGGSGPPSNTWFLGPTQVLSPNGILIGAAVFAGLTRVTDRQTDRQTDHATQSVTAGCIYIRSTAMWPKNAQIVQQTTTVFMAIIPIAGTPVTNWWILMEQSFTVRTPLLMAASKLGSRDRCQSSPQWCYQLSLYGTLSPTANCNSTRTNLGQGGAKFHCQHALADGS